MHKERLSPSTYAIDNFIHLSSGATTAVTVAAAAATTMNTNINNNSINNTKPHQFLFPPHLYKRLFDTGIFPTATSTTNHIVGAAIQQAAAAATTFTTATTIPHTTAIATIKTIDKFNTNTIPKNLLFSCTDDLPSEASSSSSTSSIAVGSGVDAGARVGAGTGIETSVITTTSKTNNNKNNNDKDKESHEVGEIGCKRWLKVISWPIG